MTPVTLDLIDYGWWTLRVPAARICLPVKLHRGHGDFTTGKTRKGQTAIVQQFDGIVRLLLPDSGACFTFPATTRARHRIVGGAFERTCGDGLRYWFRARKGRRCR